MVFFSFLFAVITCLPANAAPLFVWFRPWKDVQELARVLRTVPEGRSLLSKAETRDPQFLSKVRRGPSSITISLAGGLQHPFAEANSSPLQQLITLNKNLRLSEAVADFAHELAHFSEKKQFDPYSSSFAPGAFIREGIEGPGGELEAFETECKIAWAIERADPSFPTHESCRPYRDSEDHFAKEKARTGYYSLGRWEPRFETWKKEVPELSALPVVFRGGNTGEPYPVTLADDLHKLRIAACQNNAVRFNLVSRSKKNGRSPTSAEIQDERERLRIFHERHCQGESKK